nr:hypothetical protein Iba_chr14cCG4180 [Ipomoea batatas]
MGGRILLLIQSQAECLEAWMLARTLQHFGRAPNRAVPHVNHNCLSYPDLRLICSNCSIRVSGIVSAVIEILYKLFAIQLTTIQNPKRLLERFLGTFRESAEILNVYVGAYIADINFPASGIGRGRGGAHDCQVASGGAVADLLLRLLKSFLSGGHGFEQHKRVAFAPAGDLIGDELALLDFAVGPESFQHLLRSSVPAQVANEEVALDYLVFSEGFEELSDALSLRSFIFIFLFIIFRRTRFFFDFFVFVFVFFCFFRRIRIWFGFRLFIGVVLFFFFFFRLDIRC